MIAIDKEFGIGLDVLQNNYDESGKAISERAFEAYVYVKGTIVRTRSAQTEGFAWYLGRVLAEDVRAAKRFPLSRKVTKS